MIESTLHSACWAVIKRECQLALRQQSSLLNPLLFFIVVVSLFPLAMNPQASLLQAIAPGVIWVAALLANLLALDRLFRADYEDGFIEQYLLSPHPISALLLSKIVMHWLLTGFPLVVLSPLLAMLFHLPAEQVTVLWLSLLLGTPILSCIGAITLALTISLRGGGVLLALCLLPLSIPVLIFGAGSVMSITATAQLALLGAILLLSLAFSPWVVGSALRIGIE